METSLNCFSHCRHVILAGVVQRSYLDLAGAYIGQVDDLRSEVSTSTVRDVALSEVCHVVYQALSRGACRVMVDGKASPMTGYIIHRDPGIQPMLSKVMPGAVWKTWKPFHSDAAPKVIATVATTIAQHLQSLSPTVDSISTRRLKEQLGLGDVPKMTFTHALREIADLVPWTIAGRSLVRRFAAT
jgi:hypothetical protein